MTTTKAVVMSAPKWWQRVTPNLLTLLRPLLGVPLIIWGVPAVVNGEESWRPVVLFALIFSTDFFDGMLARRWRVTSRFGELADPLGDKAVVLACFIMMVREDLVPLGWWMVALVVFREIVVMVMKPLLFHSRDIDLPVNMSGKAKMALQCLAFLAVLMPLTRGFISSSLFWLALLMAYISFLEYYVRLRQVSGRELPAWQMIYLELLDGFDRLGRRLMGSRR